MKKKNNELTPESVRNLLEKASLNKLNIFHDRNAIIASLCRALLEAWDKEQGNHQ